MTWDLYAVLSIAVAKEEGPRLFEFGRTIAGGKPATTTYVWSTGRIGAARSAGRTRIKRRLGAVGPGITLGDDELRAVAGVTEHWARVRDEWAAFYYSSAGYPPGYGGGCYYQAPGALAERVTIGVSVLGRRGPGLEGSDEVRRPTRARHSPPGASLLGEIWRCGERFGPAAGSLVGERYGIGARLIVEARRQELRLSRAAEQEVVIERAEAAFIVSLLELIEPGADTDRTG